MRTFKAKLPTQDKSEYHEFEISYCLNDAPSNAHKVRVRVISVKLDGVEQWPRMQNGLHYLLRVHNACNADLDGIYERAESTLADLNRVKAPIGLTRKNGGNKVAIGTLGPDYNN